MIIVTWIARAWAVLFVGAWAVIGVICGAQAVRDWWKRSGRVIEDARKDVELPDIGDIDAEYRALLDKEAGR